MECVTKITSCLLNEEIASAVPKIRHGGAELITVLPFFLPHILPSFINSMCTSVSGEKQL